MAGTLLEYSLENQAGFCVITGKAGTGKTTLLRRLLNQIGADVSIGLITNTHHSFGELLRWILHAFDLDDGAGNRARQHQLFVDYLIGQYAKNRRTMLIIDEAQNMSAEALEELRMLSNINSEKDLLLQVILVGQPPLRDILRRPELEQFAQRVAVDYHLEGLSSEETRGYIRHRLRVAGGEHELFTDDACEAVFVHSGGIPRLINLLCDLALVYAYAGQAAVVTGELIEQIVNDRAQHGALPVFSAAAETRVVPRLSLKQTPTATAESMPEAVAMHGVRHAASARLVGETNLVTAPEAKAGESGPRPDGDRTRVHAIKSVPAGERQQPDAIPEPAAATMPPDMAPPAETAARSGEIAPVSVASREDHGSESMPAGLPVPSPVQPLRMAAAGGRIRVWRYAAAVAIVCLVSTAAFAWYFLDRSDLTSAAPGSKSPARTTTAVGTAGQMSANAAPANTLTPAVAPAPATAPAPTTVAASAVPGKDAAEEEARLKQIQRERDAALAVAEAAARERESMRQAALVRERALAAEHEAALARERERAARLTRAAEMAVLQAHEAELAAETKAKTAEPAAPVSGVNSGEAPASKAVAGDLARRDAVSTAAAEAGASEAAAFSANPCKGPSARFLSTCEQ
ncbi:MAG: AAA family ATPase [Pseudomonadota bacterium]